MERIPGTEKIGIAVTVHNRNRETDTVLHYLKKYTPGVPIVVVDDASATPYPGSFRFDRNVGTPVAKNKCIELLLDQGCEHLFLFDNDTFPKMFRWWEPYINSKQPHLNFTFKYPKTEIGDGLVKMDNPNGCMMYIHKSCIDKVGGFDTRFKVYGYWHANFSLRCFNAGLTSNPFMDIKGSEHLFHAMDQRRTVMPSRRDRSRFIPQNKKLYFELLKSKEYIDYKVPAQALPAPRIWYLEPFAVDKNIGKEYNEQISEIPGDPWICIMDHDVCILRPDTKKQIAEVVQRYGDRIQLFSCVTNRLAYAHQRDNKTKVCEETDIRYHIERANWRHDNLYGKITEVRRPLAGMMLLFRKSTWKYAGGFKEKSISFDTSFSEAIKVKGGRLAVMEGVYVFHLYRLWTESKTPQMEKAHLL